LSLAYHNHSWEFQSRVGEIEALYTQTDPSLVSFLLDAGHAYQGGAHLPDFLRQHAKRIVALHFRDYRDWPSGPVGARNISPGGSCRDPQAAALVWLGNQRRGTGRQHKRWPRFHRAGLSGDAGSILKITLATLAGLSH
jgi:sugar phosphate isomerase/epimerase